MRYRAEIDGLRAVAVIPVILFHAGVFGFAGGFIGVDVFFVISGYLITTIILSDLENRTFSIARFYERRARRILPALFVVMALSALPAYLLMLPDELQNFGQSVVASTAMANNVLLVLTSGYWDLDAAFKPLLHTWSLGVEEQYYVLFPVFLMLAWRLGRRWILGILVVAAVMSLAVAQWAAYRHPAADFFLLPTRGWEIVIGAFAAFRLHGATELHLSPSTRQPLALLGLACILGAIYAFDERTPFPSVYALLPTIGTVLVILFADRHTVVGKLLGAKVLVGIGLISYSAYLVHQPMIAYARLVATEPPGKMLLMGIVLATFALAYLMWRFVETPFRDRKIVPVRTLTISLVAAAAVLITVGMVFHKTEGFAGAFYGPTRYGKSDVWIAYNDRNLQLRRTEFSNDSRLKVLVVGNSYARDFLNMARESFPLTNVELAYRIDLNDCDILTRGGDIAQLVSRADLLIFGSGKYSPACVQPLVTWAEAHGKQLFFLGFKDFGFNLNQVKWKRLVLPPTESRVLFAKRLPAELAENKRNATVIPAGHFVPLMELLSRGERVRITDDDGNLLSVDRTHLTRPGAQYVGRLFHDDDNPLSRRLKEAR